MTMDTDIDAQAFWANVDRGPPDECWLWRGAKTWNGYGRLSINAKERRAHRVAYLLSTGPITKGLIVMHACDVRLCCNPGHLSLGTIRDNNNDKMAKRRQATGSAIHGSRLTASDVAFARQASRSGLSYRKIAALFEVESETVRMAVLGHNWAHLSATYVADFDGQLADLSARLAVRERIGRACKALSTVEMETVATKIEAEITHLSTKEKES